MSLPISQKEFQQISQDVCGTRPIWGMLRANEYFEINHPLRKALATKAEKQLKENGLYYVCHELIVRILDGASLAQLSNKEQTIIFELNEQPTFKKVFVPQEALFQRRREMRKQEANIGHGRCFVAVPQRNRTQRREPLRTRGGLH